MNCLHCTAETTNGLALCELCRGAASVYLENLPIYYRNLARWRPGRAGSRDVPGSREPRAPRDDAPDRVMRALDEAGNALTTWARMLTDDRGIVPPDADDEVQQVALLCRWFNENLTSIATLGWCAEFIRRRHAGEEGCDSIGYHEYQLRRLTESVLPGWYAGACRRCESGTYVVPGVSWVTCGSCGTTTYARDHLEIIIDEARPWVARPKSIAEALVAMLDTEQSVPRLYERIKKWERRGRLPSVRETVYHAKRYRLGDVLDVLEVEGHTPIGIVTSKVS